MQPMKITIEAYLVLEKTVTVSGNSGRVYVPKDWNGKRVKIMLLEPLSTETDTS